MSSLSFSLSLCARVCLCVCVVASNRFNRLSLARTSIRVAHARRCTKNWVRHIKNIICLHRSVICLLRQRLVFEKRNSILSLCVCMYVYFASGFHTLIDSFLLTATVIFARSVNQFPHNSLKCMHVVARAFPAFHFSTSRLHNSFFLHLSLHCTTILLNCTQFQKLFRSELLPCATHKTTIHSLAN